MRGVVLALASAGVLLCASGCSSYKGINSLPLPGTTGTGDGSYQVTLRMANADNMVPNTPVLIDDIPVGTVTGISLDGWTPMLTVRLGKDVRLPANATASLGQTSLLGSKHIQLAAPKDEPAIGRLGPGAVIGTDRTRANPETEDLLAGVSLLLNGGGLQSFQTITTELNQALGGGRAEDARSLLTRLDSFTGGLDQQKGDIIAAMRGLDRLTGILAPRMNEINTALRDLPGGLRTVTDEEPRIRDVLDRFGNATESLAPFADTGSKQLRGVLSELEPALRRTADVQRGTIPRALRLLPGVVFPIDAVPFLVRGDSVNLDVNLDLTNESLDAAFLNGTPLGGSLGNATRQLRDESPRLLPGHDSPAPALTGKGPTLPALPGAAPTGSPPDRAGPGSPLDGSGGLLPGLHGTGG
ncbi:MCE family protein [Pseudonocardia spinosispora]|uniref:MCE family protein n=1 Tax=Pseudonocardia spinosispora TaxID=103441 RepID=UPI0006868082|nr:MCE family protein [Pseudonocardia spinosispora]